MGTVLPFLNTFFFYRFFFVVEDSNPSALLESESLVSCPFSLAYDALLSRLLLARLGIMECLWTQRRVARKQKKKEKR